MVTNKNARCFLKKITTVKINKKAPGRATAYQSQGPQFKHQYHPEKKVHNLKNLTIQLLTFRYQQIKL
jgi:hypothetical protein